jgi:hypothetical protein
MGKRPYTDAEVLRGIFARVKIDEQGCWIWQGARQAHGYGCVSRSGKQVRVHRLVAEKFYGPIPRGMDVMHLCDRPACCNPVHLRIGSRSDNMQDCSSKGRHKRSGGAKPGAANGASKLTDEKVSALRQRRREGATIAQLEQEFGVSEGTIRPALYGKTWGHVPGALKAGEVDRRRL